MEQPWAMDSLSSSDLQAGIFSDTRTVINTQQSLAVDTGLLGQSAASSNGQLLEWWEEPSLILEQSSSCSIFNSRHWASRAISSLKWWTVSWAVSPLASFPHLVIDYWSSTSVSLVNVVMRTRICMAGWPEWSGIKTEWKLNGITPAVCRWQNGKQQISRSIFMEQNGMEMSPFLCLLLYMVLYGAFKAWCFYNSLVQ